MKWLAAIVTVAAAMALAGSAPAAEEASLVGQPAPEISAQYWLNSQPLTLKALRGKVVVVEFWATWCGPCRQSIPHLVELSKKYTTVTFIGMTEEPKGKVEPFAKELEMSYAVAGGSPTSREYGVTGIPTAFIVGGDGNVVWQGHPMSGGFVPAIEAEIKKPPVKVAPEPKGPASIDEVAAALQKNQFGRAATLLARIKVPEGDAAARNRVDRMKKTLLAQAPLRLAAGEKSLAAKDYYKADEAFQDVVAIAPDSPQGEKAAAHLKELEGDESIKLAIGEGAQKAALDQYSEILKTEKTNKNTAALIKAYEDLAERFPDTKAAAAAQLRIKALAAKKTE